MKPPSLLLTPLATASTITRLSSSTTSTTGFIRQ